MGISADKIRDMYVGAMLGWCARAPPGAVYSSRLEVGKYERKKMPAASSVVAVPYRTRLWRFTQQEVLAWSLGLTRVRYHLQGTPFSSQPP
jgi:hypothetical protein